MKKQYFWEIETDSIRGKCVLVDLDGTLVNAGEDHVRPEIRTTIDALRKHNEVALFSNSFNSKRNMAVAHALDVPYVQTHHRKPSPRVLFATVNPLHLPYLIIGDLVLTDGLLAYFTGAEYLHVQRIAPVDEPIWRKMWHWVNDCVGVLVGF